jgi:hypothetical protein
MTLSVLLNYAIKDFSVACGVDRSGLSASAGKSKGVFEGEALGLTVASVVAIASGSSLLPQPVTNVQMPANANAETNLHVPPSR